ISRAAGNEHGQELAPAELDALIVRAGRKPRQRTTLYGVASDDQRTRSYRAAALAPIVLTPPKRRRETAPGHAPNTITA
ncbi:MAG: hypothetical protein AAB131_23075, partial [Actinomycetota bacterium]